MNLLGEKIGLAFQIKDDLLDLGDTDTGKTKGIDIKEQKMTLPIIYTLNVVSSSEKKEIIRIVKRENTNESKVNWVIKRLHETGGMEYARNKMITFRDEALEILHSFPASETRNAMEQLVHFTINRKH